MEGEGNYASECVRREERRAGQRCEGGWMNGWRKDGKLVAEGPRDERERSDRRTEQLDDGRRGVATVLS